MLRPATPLSIIFFVAFVLLLLSTLSTPVIKSIPLASYQGVNLGVLGYCKDDGTCKGPVIGYSTDGLFSGGSDANNDAFSLPSDARHSLSSILIVHPIAALLALVCFALAVAAHFHGPSHSPKYLLALLILTFPTLLVTLLAFLVDILLFVPHMQWGGWIVLGATILIVASSIVTCAMRRTLVSRKARKKRIAENADMNGAAYYENLAQNRIMVDSLPKGDADHLPRAESPPPMSGNTAVEKNNAQFATFEMKRQETSSDHGAGSSYADDRVPLNPQRDPSIRSTSTNGGRRPMYDPDAPPMPPPSQDGRRPSRDQYPSEGTAATFAPAGLRHEGSQGSLNNSRSGSHPPPRGRGYGPPNRGFGPPRGRGGYGGPPSGFNGRGRGGYGPPGGFNGRGRGGYGPTPPHMMGRGGPPRPMPPPGYGADPYYNAPRSAPPPMNDHFVAGPAAPIGQAIEMDERTGSAAGPRSPVRSPVYENNAYGLRDSDGDVAGMVDMMQGRANMPPSPMSEGHREPMNQYSEQNYVPPRQQWNGAPSPSPLRSQHEEPLQMPEAQVSRATFDSTSSGQPSAAAPSSRVLPISPVPLSPTSAASGPRHNRASSDTYYEDVDPRFAEPAAPLHPAHRQSGIPNALTPGPGQTPIYHNGPSQTPVYQHTGQQHYRTNSPSPANSSSRGVLAAHAEEADVADTRQKTDQDDSDESNLRQYTHHQYQQNVTPPDHERSSGSDVGGGIRNIPSGEYLDSIPDGARSPGAASESSHFTSVSQRGVNPNWRPGPPGYGPGYGSGNTTASAAQRRKEDVILSANPDFSLPGIGLHGGRGRGRGRGGGGIAPVMGLTPAGRYPTPDVGMQAG